MIKFEKIVNGDVEYTSCGGQVIIKSCFAHCAEKVRGQVKQFLANQNKQIKTFNFGDYKIRLTKQKEMSNEHSIH